jgi:hypothetical protein
MQSSPTAAPTPQPKPGADDDVPGASVLAGVPLNDPQMRALRVAVIIMGALLVVGLLTLIGRIIYLFARPSPSAISAVTTSASIAPEIRAALPAAAQVRTIALQGDRLAIHFDAPTGSGIAIVDLASGRVLSRLTLIPDAPKP